MNETLLDTGAMTTSLAPADVASYGRDGFLFPIEIFTRDEARAWRARLEATEAAHGGRAELPHGFNQYCRVNAHVVLQMAAELARHPVILDAVEGVLGPDILVWSAEFFIKEPRTDAIITWHQDLTYWGLGETDEEITAWLALSDVTPESGCMRFVPGSHTNRIVPHEDTFAENNLLSRGQEIAVDVDEDAAVDVALRPGQLSLHHGRMFHASGPNRSDDRRIGFAIRYITPAVEQHVSPHDYAMLARGRDTHGNFRLIDGPAEDLSPEALKLYDEILNTQKVAMTEGAEREVGLYASTA